MRLDEFKALNKAKGYYWFSKDTMRFFKSRVVSFDIVTGYFISSERNGDLPRCYTIRKANFETGNVESVSEFQAYPTLQRVKTAYKRLLRGENR